MRVVIEDITGDWISADGRYLKFRLLQSAEGSYISCGTMDGRSYEIFVSDNYETAKNKLIELNARIGSSENKGLDCIVIEAERGRSR